jgi:hypothetical protein
VIDLRLGRWQDVLADVECDALITDPPYSERTHGGHRVGVDGAESGRMRTDKRTGAVYACGEVRRERIEYPAWTAADVTEFCEWACRVTRGWVVVMTDHVLVPTYEAAMVDAGRYVFAPLPLVETGRSVRLTGDGPSSWVSWIIVARPKTQEAARWGTLPGAYVVPGGMRRRHIGGKPMSAMRAIVRDYSRPGDLVCDPCGGGFTTALACAVEGRRVVSCEMDPDTFAKGKARIDEGYTPSLFATEPRRKPAEQSVLPLRGAHDGA